MGSRSYCLLLVEGVCVVLVAYFLLLLTTRMTDSNMVISADDEDLEEEYPKMDAPEIFVERTLAIFKPDVVQKEITDELEEIILAAGFTILQKKRLVMTPEQASDFYAEHYGKLFFPSLVAYMSSGPLTVMVLAKASAITYWRELIGPTNAVKARQTHPDSLRAIYGTDETRNGFHGSDSLYSADREIRFFFSDSIVEPIPRGQAARDYVAKTINPTLLAGLTALCKAKPINPVRWLADWLMEHNPNKPDVLGPEVVEPTDDTNYMYDDNEYVQSDMARKSLISKKSEAATEGVPSIGNPSIKQPSKSTLSSNTTVLSADSN